LAFSFDVLKSNLDFKIEEHMPQDESELPILSVQFIELFNEHKRLTIKVIVEHTEEKQNTLKLRLRELVNSGHLKRHGNARATWYCKSEQDYRSDGDGSEFYVNAKAPPLLHHRSSVSSKRPSKKMAS
jgi:predicted HTH transcriptional regulator